MTGNVFAAIALDDAVRHELAASFDAASTGRRMPGKLVPPENWHITVRFLGDIDEAVLDRFVHALSERLDAHSGWVRCRGLGAFPSPAKAGVLYAMVEDQAARNEKAQRLDLHHFGTRHKDKLHKFQPEGTQVLHI